MISNFCSKISYHLHRRFFLGDHRILDNIQEKSPLDVTEYYLRDQKENNKRSVTNFEILLSVVEDHIGVITESLL